MLFNELDELDSALVSIWQYVADNPVLLEKYFIIQKHIIKYKTLLEQISDDKK